MKNNIYPQEQEDRKALKQQIIVDPEGGDIKTIQQAIDQAEEGSIIKIAPGLYLENLIIKKTGLRLEPKEKFGDIILLVQRGPAVTIDLKKNEKCTILGLKMSHSGNDDEENDPDKAGNDLGNNQFEIIKQHLNPKNEIANQFTIGKKLNCIILVNGGKLLLEDCLLSLKYFI